MVKRRRMGTSRFQGDREESVCSIVGKLGGEQPQRQGQVGQQRPLLVKNAHCIERLSMCQKPKDLIKNHSLNLV